MLPLEVEVVVLVVVGLPKAREGERPMTPVTRANGARTHAGTRSHTHQRRPPTRHSFPSGTCLNVSCTCLSLVFILSIG